MGKGWGGSVCRFLTPSPPPLEGQIKQVPHAAHTLSRDKRVFLVPEARTNVPTLGAESCPGCVGSSSLGKECPRLKGYSNVTELG